MNQNWIEKNKALYKELEPGKMYIIFENQKPIEYIRGERYKYKAVRTGKKGSRKGTRRMVSPTGNFFITKIAICEICGTYKASKKLKTSMCLKCATDATSSRFYHTVIKKKPVPELITDKLYKDLVPGEIYCVFEGDEVLNFKDVKHLFKPGRGKNSPVTGARYVGRICLCKDCKKKRFSRVRLGDLCKKCQNKRNKVKKMVKISADIAFEITGKYQKVVSREVKEDPYWFVEKNCGECVKLRMDPCCESIKNCVKHDFKDFESNKRRAI